MTNKRYSDSFWAFVLATVLSFGGVGCILTGFGFQGVHLGALFWVCLLSSLLWAIAGRFPFGIPVTAAMATIFFLLPNVNVVIQSEKVLLHTISGALNSGYGWPILSWDSMNPEATAQEILLLIACIVSLVVAWTVVRQKKAILAAVIAFLPLGVCLILTDTVPDTDYLMLVLGGLVLLVLTHPLRRIDPVQANRATAILLVPVLLVTMGLFQIVPRENYTPNQSAFDHLEQWLEKQPLWQWLTDSGPSWFAGDSGADRIQLDNLGGKSDTDKVAFSVIATKDGYLYLRGRGYDTYDGKKWTASEYSTGVDNGWGSVYSNAAKVTVNMIHSRNFYYFPGESGPTLTTGYFEFGMLPNEENLLTYTFYWGDPMPRTNFISDEIKFQCLLLPEETETWAKALIREEFGYLSVYQSGLSRDVVARKLGKFVRDSAAYSLTPGAMGTGEEDFARWFLEEAEEGYCIHFATAATVLLRAIGIPARYVTGYALEVKAGAEVDVPQSRAHAWVEYYDDIYGWVILDPTPGYNDEPVDPTESSTRPTGVVTEPTLATTVPTEPTTEPTTAPTTAPTESGATQPTNPTETKPVTNATDKPTSDRQEKNPLPGKITAILLWILGICGAVWGQYLLRLRIRKWYVCRGGANEQALARWRSARIRSRIFRQKPPLQLYKLAEKAKYSQHTLTAEELSVFDRYMTGLAAKLQQKPWLLRWLLRLILAIE